MACYRRIRDLREDHDLTQSEIAAHLGMKQPQYFRYEQGYRDVPTDILIRLADYYRTTTDYILGRTDDPSLPDSFPALPEASPDQRRP
ncbi:MAG: helix-turn-helix transcriptional regulator [Christensenellaceae bacterium]|nr:helix-turn-helix transcriptional regulator [Christensenellaceae bacterium]